jgi:hypothetical protein
MIAAKPRKTVYISRIAGMQAVSSRILVII